MIHDFSLFLEKLLGDHSFKQKPFQPISPPQSQKRKFSQIKSPRSSLGSAFLTGRPFWCQLCRYQSLIQNPFHITSPCHHHRYVVYKHKICKISRGLGRYFKELVSIFSCSRLRSNPSTSKYSEHPRNDPKTWTCSIP